MFFKGSRYQDIDTNTITDSFGRVMPYKKVRFIPKTDAQVGHMVVQGDRLDNLADHFFDDPERFWKICDANLAMWPDDLVAEVGRIILIPSAEE